MITLTHKVEGDFATIDIRCDLESEQITNELVAALEAHGWDVGYVEPSAKEGCSQECYLLKPLTELKKAS